MKNAIVPNEKDLDKYLKQRKNYSFSYLKKEFGYKEDVDFLKLAEKYELTGSSIQSVAVSAAFHAVKDEKYVCMKHIKKALIAEFEKNGKAFLDEDFDTY